VAALQRIKSDHAVLDGEIVALDEAGRPRFQLLQRLHSARSELIPVCFYVFDLLRHAERSLLDWPIEKRRLALHRLLRRAPPAIRFSPTLDVNPEKLVQEMRLKGLEGIIAKANGSRYEPGQRSGAWVKHRFANEQEFVIGGYTQPSGARKYFGAILVGYYEDGRLIYAGKVGSGFMIKSLAKLHARFSHLVLSGCPFYSFTLPTKNRSGKCMTVSEMRKITWLKPRLVCQVKFSEWTHDQRLRQPVFLGLRDDKAANDVVRERSGKRE
jgi:bifunctional non-homologous end joining protein LigD